MNKELFSVQKILERRDNPSTGEREYKIKWKGYPYSQCTWEPFYHLAYIKQWVEEFDRKQDKKKQKTVKKHKIHKVGNKKKVQDQADDEQKQVSSVQKQKQAAKKVELQVNLKVSVQMKQNCSKIQEHQIPPKKEDYEKKVAKQQIQGHKILEQSKQPNYLLDSELDEEIQVVEMRQSIEGQLFFYVKFPQQLKWIPHNVMKSEYQLELINFYEKYMTFEDGNNEESDQKQD